MRQLSIGWAAFGGLFALALAGPLGAQTAAPDSTADNDTAYTALRAMARSLGKDTLDHVAEVSGRDGKPQPTQWKIILRETVGDGSREVDVAGGKVTAQEPVPQLPSAKGVIHLSDLNLDSSGAFDATDAQARKVRLRFDSVNYVLRVAEGTGKPQWTLTLFNKEDAQVGAMRLAANDGNIVSIDGRLASNPTPAPTSTPAVASSVVKRTDTVTTTRPRATVATTTHTTESRVMTTTTTVGTPPPPSPSTPVPAPPVATIADTETVDEAPADHGEGGLFTRTGRTLDKTGQTVKSTLDKTGQTVKSTLQRTGSRLQHFFTGRGGSDQDESTPLPPPPPSPPRDPNYRGD